MDYEYKRLGFGQAPSKRDLREPHAHVKRGDAFDERGGAEAVAIRLRLNELHDSFNLVECRVEPFGSR